MWLTSGREIDHTSLSEFRRKHSDELRDIFKQMFRLAINLKIAEVLESMEINVASDEDLIGQDISADRLPAAVADLQSRRKQLAAYRETVEAMDAARKKNGTKGPAQIPKTERKTVIFAQRANHFHIGLPIQSVRHLSERFIRAMTVQPATWQRSAFGNLMRQAVK